MDFKRKGITWVGSIYQKFEAVCQEVDNIINQDTVKNVENRVNSASDNVKKFYSGVVQDLLPPMLDRVKYEAQTVDGKENVAINAYAKPLSHNEENAANSVINKSSVGLSADDPVNNQLSQASCKITFVNEACAQVSNHSLLRLDAHLHSGKNDDALIDKDVDESIDENDSDGLLSGKSDGTLRNKHVLMELDAGRSLKSSETSASSRISLTNKTATLVCDDSDLQEDVLPGKNDEVLTNEVSNESSGKDVTMEIDTSDPLMVEPNCASNRVNFINEEAKLVSDESLPSQESAVLSRKNDDSSTDKNSDESLKMDVLMELDSNHPLKNNPNHTSSESVIINKETSLVSNDSHFLLGSDVLPGEINSAVIDNDIDKVSIKDGIFEPDANNNFLNPLIHSCSSFTCKEAILVSDSNLLQLEPELLPGKNDDALTQEYANASCENDAIEEHDASYRLNYQPRRTSSSLNCENEDVTSVSYDAHPELESKLFLGKNSEALVDTEAGLNYEAHSNWEFSTEPISFCDQDSFKVSTTNELFNSEDIDSIHEVGQASNILVDNLVNFPPNMETASIETDYSSNASEPTSSKPLILACENIVGEMRSVSSSKSLSEEYFSASRHSVENFFSNTVHNKPVDQCSSDNVNDLVACAFFENKAMETSLAFPERSNLSVQSLENASRAHENGFLPELCAKSKSTSSETLDFSSELGHLYNSGDHIMDTFIDMETIDLKDKVTLRDIPGNVDCRALHAVSRRAQKLRSYKERIQDAFTSKKRLAREYELLAIWFGDVDLELRRDGSQNLPFSSQTPFDSKNAPASYASDSEWELL